MERLSYVLCNSHIIKSLASEKIGPRLHKHFGKAEQCSRSFLDDFETFFSSLSQPQPVIPRAEREREREREREGGRSLSILSSACMVPLSLATTLLGL